MQNLNRRDLLAITLGTVATGWGEVWAQTPTGVTGARALTVAQIVDTSPNQVDLSKDFLVGSRAAWKDINAKGGLRGSAVRHLVLEVDGSPASVRTAVDSIKNIPQCLAMFGTTGDRVASQVSELLRIDVPDLAHIAPWLQSPDADTGDNTFPIFATRFDQITHAINTLSVMGVTTIGAVYGSHEEHTAYRASMEQIAAKLNIRLTSLAPSHDLRLLGSSLVANSPRVLVFLGGTPELVQFAQGVEAQAAQRYIVAMSDVNLQTISQVVSSKYASVIATQVVPMTNVNIPIVKNYRDSLGRLYDEPPTPHSLAGFIAARYTYESVQNIGGTPTRQNVLQAMQKRGNVDLGGFRIAPHPKTHSGTYVTQSMISASGRLLG
jgi:ABC-type branched-subunit amino acid transport system substrate-binding protein